MEDQTNMTAASSDAASTSNDPANSTENGAATLTSATPEASANGQNIATDPEAAVASADAAPATEAPQEAATPSQSSAEFNVQGAQPQASATPDAQTPPQPAETQPAPPTVEAPAPAEPLSQSSRRAPSMAQLMESDEFASFMSGADALQRGALMRGVVVRVDEAKSEVLVDIGTKSEGIIARSELGEDEVNVGDEIEVVVLRPEDEEGHPVLSKRRADYEKTWRGIMQAKQDNSTLEGTVVKEVKGGLIVNLGVEAFVPASQVDARHRGDLSRFVGRVIPVRVLETDRKKNKVVASHKAAAEEDRQKREEEVFSTLQKDKVVEGIVRRITEFGAFVDIGGVDGLLHVREMGWSRVEHPDQVVKKGQKLQLLVLDIDRDRKRIALGLKQLLPDPWKKAAKSFPSGAMITGKVVRIAPTCAFVELEDGVEAILPISEMSEERIKTPEDVLSVGQEIEARVKQNQANQRRIVLSLRAAQQERERRETRQAIREVNTRGADDGLRLGDVFGSALRQAQTRGKERNEARAQADRKAARARALEAADLEEDDIDLDDAGHEDYDEAEDVENGTNSDVVASSDEASSDDEAASDDEDDADRD